MAKSIRVWVPFSLVVALGGPASAQIPVPPDLERGDRYHLIFSSSTLTQGVSSDIEHYNGVAQAAADAAGIGASEGITWSAIGSTAAVDARDNAVVGAATPVYNMNLDRVANGEADLWDGSLAAPLQWDENGQPLALSPVIDTWTGSGANGVGISGLTLGSGTHPQCDLPTGPSNGAPCAICGQITQTDTEWMLFSIPELTRPLRVYALSEEITVPEPAAGSSAALALVLIAWLRRLRSR